MLPLCSTTRPSTISAEEIWILRDPLIPTWTDSSLKSSPHWPPLWDSMVPWTSISPNSRPIWYHIQESISCCHHTLQLSPPKKLITNNCPLLKSPTLPSNPPTWWPNVIQDTENTWLAPWCTEETSYPKTLMLPSPPSKPKEPSNSSIGAQPDSKSVSTINHPPSFQVEIWPKSWEPSVWFPTLPLLLKSSPD